MPVPSVDILILSLAEPAWSSCECLPWSLHQVYCNSLVPRPLFASQTSGSETSIKQINNNETSVADVKWPTVQCTFGFWERDYYFKASCLASSEYIVFPIPHICWCKLHFCGVDSWSQSHNHKLSAFCTASKQNVWSRPRNWADLAILTNSSHWSCLVVHFQLYTHQSLYTHQRTLLLIRRPPSVFITSPKLLLTTLPIGIIYNIIFFSQ